MGVWYVGVHVGPGGSTFNNEHTPNITMEEHTQNTEGWLQELQKGKGWVPLITKGNCEILHERGHCRLQS